MKKRFSVEQMIGMLKQSQAGVPVGEVIRKAGISEQTFYRWKSKYAGFEVDQVRQMAQLQEENQRLKRLVADLSWTRPCCRMCSQKSGEAFAAGPMVEALVRAYGVAERRECRVLLIQRATYRYRSGLDPRTELRMRIREIAHARVRYGYRKIRVLLNREGWDVSKYLVYRLYCEEGLCLQRMRPAGKRKGGASSCGEIKGHGPDEAWSMDFVADQLQDGTRFRSLTIVDVFTREAVAIEAGQCLKGDDVVRTLNRVKLERSVPRALFCDSGSEFTSQAMDLWAYRNRVKIDFFRPGKPTDNAFVESFNGTFRAECLNTHWFADMKEARTLIEAWRKEYNDSGPHASLADRTPSEFASHYAACRVMLKPKPAAD